MTDWLLPTIPVSDDITDQAWAEDVIDALSNLNARLVQAEGISYPPNGSFEELLAGVPEGWTPSATGSATIHSSSVTFDHGSLSLRMLTNTGDEMSMLADTFAPVSGGIDTVYIRGSVRQDAASAVSGDIVFYDGASSPSIVSTVPFMVETSLPGLNAWYEIVGHADAPAAARYYRIRLTGGDSTVSSQAITNTFWDGIRASIAPYDWVWDYQTLGNDGNGTFTYTAVSVGYPKEVAIERISNAATVSDVLVKGWDGVSAYSTDFVRGAADTETTQNQSPSVCEPSLNATGQFQVTISGSTGNGTTYQRAYR